MASDILTKYIYNYRAWRYNHGQQIKYYNFWSDQHPEEMWLSIFILKNFPQAEKKRINITSVLGPEWMIKDNRSGINIFYTGENLHIPRFDKQRNRLKQSYFDLYIGFDTSTEGKHLRIPIWLLWCFPPDGDRESINAIVNKMRFPSIGNRQDFCCLVSSHDWSGLRGEIMDNLQDIGRVSSAGAFRHNTDALHKDFGDDKIAFMRQYKFAICPENSNTEGYVTEKIFDAFLSGCIPIYHGSNNNPEPEIINHKAVIFWKPNGDNTTALSSIRSLVTTTEMYQDFVNQPRLLPNAEEYIIGMYHSLKQSLSSIL